MRITILVAIITSISTLLGVLIAGLISQSIQKKQLKAQAELAKLERSEQYRQAVADGRKLTYVQFLNSLDSFERLVQKCWQERGVGDGESKISDSQAAAIEVLTGSDGPLNLIALEGPVEVLAKADSLHRMLGDELSYIIGISTNKDFRGKILMTAEGSRFNELVSQRRLARMEFIRAGQKAIYGSRADELEVQATDPNNLKPQSQKTSS